MTAFLNSRLFRFVFREYFPELLGDTRELSKVFFENVRVIPIDDSLEYQFSNLVEKIASTKMKGETYISFEEEIEDLLANIYLLSDNEKKLIHSNE